jgi:hypothetical protein
MSTSLRPKNINSNKGPLAKSFYPRLEKKFRSERWTKAAQLNASLKDDSNEDYYIFLLNQFFSHLNNQEVESALLKYEACNLFWKYNFFKLYFYRPCPLQNNM